MQPAGVLRGANPSEVEQPTRFEMMITLKTALDIDIRPGCSPAPTRLSSKDFFAALHYVYRAHRHKTRWPPFLASLRERRHSVANLGTYRLGLSEDNL